MADERIMVLFVLSNQEGQVQWATFEGEDTKSIWPSRTGIAKDELRWLTGGGFLYWHGENGEASAEGDDRTQADAGGSEEVVGQVRHGNGNLRAGC